ncbi:hypothetical protein DICVIV_06843 [Dictyocaulus viviparus]|uniref:Alpha-ketoglutarate-dependent dioxygenase AlkB-like domain-containing protein n=1 Tax=Dictyocaulus viviparus TaxID=29172 RepID=A0A0D8XQX5_DICVI|nr:hypothetical protein DICVIV_06843 [Dictyocaulus viviparus]
MNKSYCQISVIYVSNESRIGNELYYFWAKVFIESIIFHAESEKERYVGSMLLEPRSLFLMTDEAYVNMLHGIKEVTEDYIDEHVFNGQRHLGETLIRGTRQDFYER